MRYEARTAYTRCCGEFSEIAGWKRSESIGLGPCILPVELSSAYLELGWSLGVQVRQQLLHHYI